MKLQMKPVFTFFGAIAMALVVLGTSGCEYYNRLVTLRQGTDRSWADVQNVYQRRTDLIPNLVRTVEGSANFEKSTLTEVIQARQQVNKVQLDLKNAPDNPELLKQYQHAQDGLSGALSRLMVVVEKYPDLKSTEAFRELQTQLEGTENRIAVERRKFNESIQNYNNEVQTLPAALYAKLLGFFPKPYFSAQAGSEQPPTVQFNNIPGSSPAPTISSPAPVPTIFAPPPQPASSTTP